MIGRFIVTHPGNNLHTLHFLTKIIQCVFRLGYKYRRPPPRTLGSLRFDDAAGNDKVPNCTCAGVDEQRCDSTTRRCSMIWRRRRVTALLVDPRACAVNLRKSLNSSNFNQNMLIIYNKIHADLRVIR